MTHRKPKREITFKFFDFKWAKVPQWAEATQQVYRHWYLQRYGYRSAQSFAAFLRSRRTILDAGCGLGRDSRFFAELSPQSDILAVDQSPRALDVASKTLRGFPNCKVLRMDLTRFSYGHRFDFISCDQVLHHTPEPSRTVKRLFAQLNPGGILNFSVCRKKNRYRDYVDDLIMDHAQSMAPEALWEFARVVTEFGRALHGLGIKNVNIDNKRYDNLQLFVHNNVFRCWYRPDVDFDLSVSSNYDWFSGNPRFTAAEVKNMIASGLNGTKYTVARVFEDDATISVAVEKGAVNVRRRG